MNTYTPTQKSRANRPEPDEALQKIADYVHDYVIDSNEAYNTARICFADTLGCGILALNYPDCTKLLGPVVQGTVVPDGCRVPGTDYVLDPIRGAFNIGTMVRWLDYNDTWLAAEWGHPSDNLGGILAIADHLGRKTRLQGRPGFAVRDILTAMIKAHEIQGGIALLNSFNRSGFDHVILVKAATAAVASWMMGGTKEQTINALSNVWADAGPLRVYRHAPNTGSRKSWAAGDAASRGVMFALMALQGEMGYPAVLTAPKWGFYDVVMKGKPFEFQRPLGSYVMENVLFKISYPAEFHAQTAVEAAVLLHPQVRNKLDQIERIEISTHESAIRIIDKKGPLHNPADRDHCLQYMIAIGLIHGHLNADHYHEEAAGDVRIDELREKMVVTEDKEYSREYLDPETRSIANAIKIYFKDGESTEKVEVEFPLGHRKRRKEGIPLLFKKFEANLKTRYREGRVKDIVELFHDHESLLEMPLVELMDMF